MNELLYFFFLSPPLDLRYRGDLFIFPNSGHIVIICTRPLYSLHLFYFPFSFSVSTPTQSQYSTFPVCSSQVSRNYNFQNLLTVWLQFIFCQWKALIKDLEGKITAGVISFLPSGFRPMRFYSTLLHQLWTSNSDFLWFLTWLTETSYFSER